MSTSASGASERLPLATERSTVRDDRTDQERFLAISKAIATAARKARRHTLSAVLLGSVMLLGAVALGVTSIALVVFNGTVAWWYLAATAAWPLVSLVVTATLLWRSRTVATYLGQLRRDLVDLELQSIRANTELGNTRSSTVTVARA